MIVVRFPAVFLNDSVHPSTDTGFTGKKIDPSEIAACVPNEIQATKFRLTSAPTSAPYLDKKIEIGWFLGESRIS